MTALEKLAKLVNDSFEEAKTPEEIKKQTELKNAVEEAKDENKKLLDNQADLIKSYKELVKTSGTKEEPKDNPTTPSAPDFEESLNKFLENKEKK